MRWLNLIYYNYCITKLSWCTMKLTWNQVQLVIIMKNNFRIFLKEQRTGSVVVLYGEAIIIFTKTRIMESVDIKILVWILVENKSCRSCIYHKITAVWSIIKIISCNTPINNLDSHTPYFYVFVYWYLFMTEEVINITTQPITSSEWDTYGTWIG